MLVRATTRSPQITIFFCVLFGFFMSNQSSYPGEVADLFEKLNGNPNWDSSHSRSYEETRSKVEDIQEIGLERTKCYGTCPAYSFIVKEDGSFQYTGIAFVKRLGKHTGKVKMYELNEVFKAIKDLGYMAFENEYSVGVTDNPTVYTMVVMKWG